MPVLSSHLHRPKHRPIFSSSSPKRRMSSSSVSAIKKVCVFCGSNMGKTMEFAAAANHLGHVLAKEKLHLVYGGGDLGLMGCVARAMHEKGSFVLGIVPTPMKPHVGETVGEELEVPDMPERLAQMISRSDAFIALPGGLGTLEEIFHIATWSQLNIHQKPIGLLNINHFFDELLYFLDSAVEKGFIASPTRQIIISASTPEELLKKLRAYTHNPHPVVAQIDWSGGVKKKRPLDLSLHL